MLKEILIALKIIPQEAAIQTIVRAKAEIARVTERNVAQIEEAIEDEISVIRFTITEAFERITDLIATGAVSGKTAEALVFAQNEIYATLAKV